MEQGYYFSNSVELFGQALTPGHKEHRAVEADHHVSAGSNASQADRHRMEA
jgi:hypothetical protein